MHQLSGAAQLGCFLLLAGGCSSSAGSANSPTTSGGNAPFAGASSSAAGLGNLGGNLGSAGHGTAEGGSGGGNAGVATAGNPSAGTATGGATTAGASGTNLGANASTAGGGGGNNGGAGGSSGGSGNSAGKKFVGNITTGGAVRGDFLDYWGQLTPENETKWASVESTRDVMVWTGADAAHDFAKTHGIPFKFHTFVWGSQFPGWLNGLAPEDQAAEVEEWIQAACMRYPDLQLIDVVNEPDHTPPPFAAALGGNADGNYAWIVWSFKKARQYCKNATLILNDYNVLRYDTDKYINIVKKAVAAGAPIDALGEQAHGLETQPLSELKANLAKLLALGLPLYITEYDVDQADDAQQQAIISAQFPVFWLEPQIKGITLWGYVYGQTWRPNTGLLKGSTPRPALTWLMDYIK